MKFAARINSFMKESDYSLSDTIEACKKLDGLTHLEFNYPEHLNRDNAKEVQKLIGDMPINGLAMRFKTPFISGEFTNPNEVVYREAVDLCKEAIDICRMLKGDVLTVWLGYDGFDYPFQMDYENKWNKIVHSFQEIADYGHDLKISIEYKPYEPRAHSMLDGIGLTLLIIEEVNRPNLGVTLDFCHMLMKGESPAYAMALAARKDRLFGLHLNDGYRNMDNGLIFGSVNLPQAFEMVYYIKKYQYDGVIFFDTFPFRENTEQEVLSNIETYQLLNQKIEQIGMEQIQDVILQQDGVQAQRLLMQLISC